MNVKKTFATIASSCALLPCVAICSFDIGPEAFDPKGGHIQGIAASEDALYVAQMTRLVKLDWKGSVLATRAVTSHTGDIAWHDGELYTAVAVSHTPDGEGPAGKHRGWRRRAKLALLGRNDIDER